MEHTETDPLDNKPDETVQRQKVFEPRPNTPNPKGPEDTNFVMKGQNLVRLCKNSTNYTLVTSAGRKQNTNSTGLLTEILILSH